MKYWHKLRKPIVTEGSAYMLEKDTELLSLTVFLSDVGTFKMTHGG